MLELAILGYLRKESLHGYELKRRINWLAGHYRPVSDGALYPAIARLERQGFIIRHEEPGQAGAPRQVLSLTRAGEVMLYERLRQPEEMDITDRNRFFTLLAFLRFLMPEEQLVILLRRYSFLEGGRSFFQKNGVPISAGNETDFYRKGMLQIAREISAIEKKWLMEAIQNLQNGADST